MLVVFSLIHLYAFFEAAWENFQLGFPKVSFVNHLFSPAGIIFLVLANLFFIATSFVVFDGNGRKSVDDEVLVDHEGLSVVAWDDSGNFCRAAFRNFCRDSPQHRTGPALPPTFLWKTRHFQLHFA